MVSKRSDEVVSSQPEEVSIIARVGESIKVPTKLMEKKPKRGVDLKNITGPDDLKSIQKQDPFMYYSIPEVRSAKVLMRDIDTYNLLGGAPQGVQEQSAQELAPPKSKRVRRTTRLSFECHPDLILGDVLNELYGLDNEDTEEPLDEDLCCETCRR
jgi:hypothetical protein